jgi:hypothetical protein
MSDLDTIVDDLDKPIWGASAFSRVIGRSESETNYLLIKRRIDASKNGGRWVSTPRRLLRSLERDQKAS